MTQKRPVLDSINIVVRDVDAAVTFYQKLGMDIPQTLPEWQLHHRTAAVDGEIDVAVDFDSSEFAAQWNAGWPAETTGVVIGFRIASREEVDALYQELTGAGHVGQQPPYDAFWGARYAIVLDPSGNSVGLMSPVDPARRTRPPNPPAS